MGMKRRRRSTHASWFVLVLDGWWALLLSSLSGSHSSSSHPFRMEGLFQEDSVLLCRVILFDTMYVSNNRNLRYEHETACIPIHQNRESDTLLRLALPDSIYAVNQAKIRQSSLYVVVRGARLTAHEVVLGEGSHVAVVEPSIRDTRHLEKKSNSTSRTVAVVRISVVDSLVTKTAEEIDSILFGQRGINFVKQYAACSCGAMRWKRSAYGVLDVKLNHTLSELGDSTSIATIALKQIRDELRLGSVTDLADHVMVCIPPGTGDWAANAGVNYWRSQYNDEWCTSLSATMHELGHNLGLLHSNEGVVYGDNTGYMAGGYKNTDWPLRCFNGQNHWYLGWYQHRRLSVDPFLDGPKLIRLAAFVDYDKTESNEPVLLDIRDELYVQFNRARGFNRDTGEKRDKVTITKAEHGGTQCLEGLSAGETFNYVLSNGAGLAKLVIEVCEMMLGNETSSDVMLVSVAFDASLCDNRNDAMRERTKNAIYTPSEAPSVLRTHASRNASKMSLTRLSVQPSRATFSSPSPSIQRSTGLSHPPSFVPTPIPSSASGCDRFGVVCEGQDGTKEYATRRPRGIRSSQSPTLRLPPRLPSMSPSRKSIPTIPTIWKVWTTTAETPSIPVEASPLSSAPTIRPDHPMAQPTSAGPKHITRQPVRTLNRGDDESSATTSFGSESMSESNSDSALDLPLGGARTPKSVGFNFSSIFEASSQGRPRQSPLHTPHSQQSSVDSTSNSSSNPWGYFRTMSSAIFVGLVVWIF